MKTETDRSVASPEPDEGSGKRRNPILRFLGEMPGLIIMSLILAILIKTFLIQAFYIPSQSMEDTLQINDRVLVSKIPYYLHDPQRGDVIVFSEPDPAKQPQRSFIGGIAHWIFEGIGVQKPDNPDYIKRVIGEPGDTVEIRDDGLVYINGTAIHEPYLYSEEPGGEPQPTTAPLEQSKWTVPEGELCLMGDHRANSADSRTFGPVPIDRVIGRAWLRYWPLSAFGILQTPTYPSLEPAAP